MTKVEMDKFYEAFSFLKRHRIFAGRFLENLYIMVVKVDPRTKRIEDNAAHNTLTQVWLETGPLNKDRADSHEPEWTHDIYLDCGGDTFEEAIIRLATKVRRRYGVG